MTGNVGTGAPGSGLANANAGPAMASLTTLNSSMPTAVNSSSVTPGMVANASGGLPMSGPLIAGPTSGLASILAAGGSGGSIGAMAASLASTISASNLGTGSVAGMSGMPEAHTNDPNWRLKLEPAHRHKLVQKLIDAFCDCVSPQDLREKEQNIKQLAVKIEDTVFQEAQKMDEYYLLLAEKIYKLKKAQQGAQVEVRGRENAEKDFTIERAALVEHIEYASIKSHV